MPGCVVRGPVAAQPVGGFVEAGKVADLVAVQEGQPPVDLPLVESVRPAEAVQPLRLPVHPAQLGRALDELERQAAARGQVVVERRRPAAVHRTPAVDRLHHVERHAEQIAGVVGGDQLGMWHIGPAQRADQSDLAQQPVDAGRVGAGAGHAQHHAMVAAMDQVQRVLRAPGQLLEDRFFAVTGSRVRVQPAPQYHCIQHPHTPLSDGRIAFSAEMPRAF